MKKIIKWGLIVLVVIVVLAVLFGGNAQPDKADSSAPATATQTTDEPAAAPVEPATPEAPATPDMTSEQENAVGTAQDYLDTAGFSRSGLIGQLVYEGYKRSDARFAVNHLKVDWNEQAAKTAQEYLDSGHFSHQGLVDQLVFEGYTQQQAEYGASQVS